MSTLGEQRARLEHALNTGQGVRHLGEPGVRPASPEFLKRLDELPPSARRLALAKACALPRKDDVAELPDCYRWELRRAIDDWHEDRVAYPDADATVARIFDDVPEPISRGAAAPARPRHPQRPSSLPHVRSRVLLAGRSEAGAHGSAGGSALARPRVGLYGVGGHGRVRARKVAGGE